MSKRLKILETSLEKKVRELDLKFDNHFADVRRANGQPLNDKRNGRVTMDRWDRQSAGIRKQMEEIERTERAICTERSKILESEFALDDVPQAISDLVALGKLKQWRKHPTVFFVEGVDKARIQWKDGKLVHRYSSHITCKEQWAIFRDIFNGLNKALKDEFQ